MIKASAIVQKGHPVLEGIAQAVPQAHITSDDIKKILQDMRDALAGEPDGVALAAPQIGVPLRIFIISDKAYSKKRSERRYTFINPRIVNHSKQKHLVAEGCLSVRWKYGETYRYKQATIEAYDENGESFTMSGSKLIAQIFQHETDHLDGILFDEHAENLRDMTDEEIAEIQGQKQD